MCGYAHRDREDVMECQMAPKDRKERRICNSRRESQHLLLSGSYRRLRLAIIDCLACSNKAFASPRQSFIDPRDHSKLNRYRGRTA